MKKHILLKPIAKKIELPRSFKSPHGPYRYRADSIIRHLKKLDVEAHRIVGITGYEIATTKYSNHQTKTIKKPEWRYKDW